MSTITSDLDALRFAIEDLKSRFATHELGDNWTEEQCAGFLRRADLHYPQAGEYVSEMAAERAWAWVGRVMRGVVS